MEFWNGITGGIFCGVGVVEVVVVADVVKSVPVVAELGVDEEAEVGEVEGDDSVAMLIGKPRNLFTDPAYGDRCGCTSSTMIANVTTKINFNIFDWLFPIRFTGYFFRG